MRFERTRKSRNKLLSYHITSAIFSLLSLISYSIKIDSVPGRMGMLMVLYLIQINTHTSVEAPLNRGFSLIETWFIGVQVPIILAILEYAVLLTLEKFWGFGLITRASYKNESREHDGCNLIFLKIDGCNCTHCPTLTTTLMLPNNLY